MAETIFMRTAILLGPNALKSANELLTDKYISGVQDLAPEYVNTTRILVVANDMSKYDNLMAQVAKVCANDGTLVRDDNIVEFGVPSF